LEGRNYHVVIIVIPAFVHSLTRPDLLDFLLFEPSRPKFLKTKVVNLSHDLCTQVHVAS